MKINGYRYRLEYDSITQSIHIIGDFREKRESSLQEFHDFLSEVYQQVKGQLVVDFSKLHYINTSALLELANFFQKISDDSKLKLILNVTKIIDWQIRVLSKFEELPNLYLEVYDNNFYGGQQAVEDPDFIEVLRNQTRILWDLEKEILVKHGLKKGMNVADVCCGCGDFTALVAKHMNVSSVIGYDHSEPSILHARHQAKQFILNNLDFFIADATSICIPNNSFDFVTCRLSLQIFSHPQVILKELYRIVKPGGRVYVTCEDFDMIVSYPSASIVRKLYDQVGALCQSVDMDFYSGRKLSSWFRDFKFQNIKVDNMIPDTENCDRKLFAEVIKSWKYFYGTSVANSGKLSEKEKDVIRKGFDSQVSVILNQGGYSNWSIVACSGTKPVLS